MAFPKNYNNLSRGGPAPFDSRLSLSHDKIFVDFPERRLVLNEPFGENGTCLPLKRIGSISQNLFMSFQVHARWLALASLALRSQLD